MCRILFLTKCVYAEKDMEDRIRKLGHEVLCSTSLLEEIQREQVSESFLKGFQVILLSETITNQDSQEILPKIQNKIKVVIQVGDAGEEAKKMGIKALSSQASLESVRETLAVKTLRSKDPVIDSEEMMSRLILTQREYHVLEELLNNDNQPLSQEELCRRVWGKEALDMSVKCQLSTLIRKLRDKIENAGYDSRRLKTERGKGYLFQQN